MGINKPALIVQLQKHSLDVLWVKYEKDLIAYQDTPERYKRLPLFSSISEVLFHASATLQRIICG
jgi:hypothetical protein